MNEFTEWSIKEIDTKTGEEEEVVTNAYKVEVWANDEQHQPLVQMYEYWCNGIKEAEFLKTCIESWNKQQGKLLEKTIKIL